MMDIVIVGASIFGLVAAVALSEKGHKVTVLESNAELNAFGSSVVLWPCATKLLQSWGLETVLAPHTTLLRCFCSRDGYTGEVLGHSPCNMGDAAMLAHGARWWCIPRKGFLDTLLNVAEKRGVRFMFNERVQLISEDDTSSRIQCDSGRAFTAELVLGADGINSTARKQIPGVRHIVPQTWNEQHLLCHIQRSDSAHESGFPDLVESDLDVTSYMMAGKSVLTWPGSSPVTLQLELAIQRQPDAKDVPCDWSARDNPRSIQEHLTQTWPPLSEALTYADPNVMAWVLADLPSLSTWSSPNSRIVLGGEAAHAMLPHSAASATCAIEDAAVLAEALNTMDSGSASTSALKRALRSYEQARMPRTSRLQELSREHHGFLSLEGAAAEQRNGFLKDLDAKMWAALQAPEEERREILVKGLSPQFPSAWLYGFDALEDYKDVVTARQSDTK